MLANYYRSNQRNVITTLIIKFMLYSIFQVTKTITLLVDFIHTSILAKIQSTLNI